MFDLGGFLDRLASRRYIESPWARPTWWTPYELPPALRDLDPVPNTRFFRSGPDGRTDGGLFSLDGVHPTTIAYGLVAQEVINVMEPAGVQFDDRSGDPRGGPVEVDFDRLVAADTLISHPPAIDLSHAEPDRMVGRAPRLDPTRPPLHAESALNRASTELQVFFLLDV